MSTEEVASGRRLRGSLRSEQPRPRSLAEAVRSQVRTHPQALVELQRLLHMVDLSSAGRVRHCRIHQLVLSAFVGPRPDGLETRHLDGVRSNNRLSNLRYGTKSENAQDRVRHCAQRVKAAA